MATAKKRGAKPAPTTRAGRAALPPHVTKRKSADSVFHSETHIAVSAGLQTAYQKKIDERIKRVLAEIGKPPFPYTDELGECIGKLIASRVSIEKIAMLDGMPSSTTMFGWIANSKHPFAAVYACNKEICVASMEEEIEDVAQNTEVGETVVEKDVMTKFGMERMVEIRRGDMVQHRQLKINTLQWTLAHLRPRKHGRQAANDGDKPNNQLDALFDALKSGPAPDDND